MSFLVGLHRHVRALQLHKMLVLLWIPQYGTCPIGRMSSRLGQREASGLGRRAGGCAADGCAENRGVRSPSPGKRATSASDRHLKLHLNSSSFLIVLFTFHGSFMEGECGDRDLKGTISYTLYRAWAGFLVHYVSRRTYLFNTPHHVKFTCISIQVEIIRLSVMQPSPDEQSRPAFALMLGAPHGPRPNLLPVWLPYMF